MVVERPPTPGRRILARRCRWTVTGAYLGRLVANRREGLNSGGREWRVLLLWNVERRYGRTATKGDSLEGRKFVETTWVSGAGGKTPLAFIRDHSCGPAVRPCGTQSSSSISDYLIFPVLMGPSGIRNRFDYLLILARRRQVRGSVFTTRSGWEWNPRIVLTIDR